MKVKNIHINLEQNDFSLYYSVLFFHLHTHPNSLTPLLTMSGTMDTIQQYFTSSSGTIRVDPLVTILVLVVAFLVRQRYSNGLNKIPGPFLASLTSLWKWNVVRKEQMPFLNTELHEKLGPLVRIGPNHISASSAESIQVVHRAKSGFTKVRTCLP